MPKTVREDLSEHLRRAKKELDDLKAHEETQKEGDDDYDDWSDASMISEEMWEFTEKILTNIFNTNQNHKIPLPRITFSEEIIYIKWDLYDKDAYFHILDDDNIIFGISEGEDINYKTIFFNSSDDLDMISEKVITKLLISD